jgi:hypothetical protein
MGASKSTRRRCESSKEKWKTQRRNYRSRPEKTFTANESALGGQKKSEAQVAAASFFSAKD